MSVAAAEGVVMVASLCNLRWDIVEVVEDGRRSLGRRIVRCICAKNACFAEIDRIELGHHHLDLQVAGKSRFA